MEENYVFAVVSLLVAIGEGYEYQNRMTIQREHYSWPKGTEMSTHHGGRLTTSTACFRYSANARLMATSGICHRTSSPDRMAGRQHIILGYQNNRKKCITVVEYTILNQ